MSRQAGPRASKQVDLAQVSMPRLLFALLHQRFTGTLVLEQPPPHAGPRTVWVRGGMPVFTNWVAPTEVLGQVLMAHRIIDEAQLLRALEAMAAEGGLLGQHLLAQGALDPSRLYEGLRQQCMRKLCSLFGLRAGSVRVAVSEGHSLEPELLPVNVLGLVLTGVGAAYDEARVEAEMGPALRAPLRATSALQRYHPHFRFRPGDEPIVQALVAGSSLAQLAVLPGATLRRAAQVVYTLWACQMLRTGVAAQAETGAHPVSRPAMVSAPVAAASTPSRPPASRSASPPAPPPAAPRASAPSAPAPRASAPSAPAKPPPRASSGEAAGGRPASESSDSFMTELEALEAKLDGGAHAFDLFGVPLTATKKDVRRAWSDLSRKFHPDALKGELREQLRERVNRVFAALSEAQQTLNDADQRAKLKESIEQGEHEVSRGGRDATATARAVFQSELLAKEADKLLRANRFDRALAQYREAATYNPDEPDLRAAITWCEYQLSDKGSADMARARSALSAIIEDSPKTARSHYFMGFVLIDQGSPAVAIETFRKAARLDPRLIDAERQARALEVRIGRTPASSTQGPAAAKAKRGGFKGLFGKK